jgi:hypothetical protein
MMSFFLRVTLCCLLFSCAPASKKYMSRSEGDSNSAIAPDYSNISNWAAHPYKKDPSDSIPQPLQAGYSQDSTVDVFFIHPTSLTDMADSSWNASLNDAAINNKTDYGSILYQASVFNEYRVFAPRYRQAHLRSYYTTDTAAAMQAFHLAYQDVKTAFEYYLQNYNRGRPIILASHSQGSTHAQRLLKEFFDNKPLQSQLVVAYAIGMYIPNTYFSTLKMCADSLQTNCLCGWRTYKKGYKPPFVIKENGTGLVTNPLNWLTDTTYAGYALNKGSVLTKFNKISSRLTDAQIKDGILWIGRLHMRGGFLVKRKNFHVGDINLFYINIREDIKRRVRYYLKN